MSGLSFDNYDSYGCVMGFNDPADCLNDLFDMRATSHQRCEMIRAQIKSLYLLAYMLTASRELAESALISAVDHILCDDSIDTELRSWSIRILALKSVSAIRGASDHDPSDTWSAEDSTPELADLVNAVTGLAPMERHVFVLSVLERFADMECAILLDCNLEEVAEIRTSALQHLTSNLIGDANRCVSKDA
jgi:DNA-directed RNA polymerase specialized sigma24 family protein